MRSPDPKGSFLEANSHGHPILRAENHVGSAIEYNYINTRTLFKLYLDQILSST